MRSRRATVQWRHLVNWREAARCGEWAQHFSNASCYKKSAGYVVYRPVSSFHLLRLYQAENKQGIPSEMINKRAGQ